jgi:hypothetical protein
MGPDEVVVVRFPEWARASIEDVDLPSVRLSFFPDASGRQDQVHWLIFTEGTWAQDNEGELHIGVD